MISKVGYDAETRILYVQFNNKAVYSYKNVPIHIYVDMLGSESKGQFFLQNIKNIYEYEREINIY